MTRRRVLSERELTVSFLQRQMLTERRRGTVAAAASRLVAMQAQYSPSPYLALHARLERFDRSALQDALRRGSVVKSTLWRGTLHVVSAADYPYFAGALRDFNLTNWRRWYDCPPAVEQALIDGLREYLVEPRGTDEIRAKVSELSDGAVPDRVRLHTAKALLPLVHVPPSGFWRQHGAPEMVGWAGEDPPAQIAGVTRFVRRYLAAFGPATRDDITTFSALRFGHVDAALAELDSGPGGLRRLTDADGRDLFDLPGAPLPDEATATPVRFLPKWDSAVLGHKDRTRILPAPLRDTVIRRVNGDVAATFLVDGKVAGTWTTRLRGKVATLTAQRLVPLAGADEAAVAEEAERVVRFVEPDATRHAVAFETHPAAAD